jgi:hypothetical protein
MAGGGFHISAYFELSCAQASNDRLAIKQLTLHTMLQVYFVIMNLQKNAQNQFERPPMYFKGSRAGAPKLCWFECPEQSMMQLHDVIGVSEYEGNPPTCHEK